MTSMPYMLGFLNGWKRCGEIYVDLLPKYYVTPRTLPIVKQDGKRDFYEINKPNTLAIDYDPKSLAVTVEPGVNFAVQKQMALKQIENLMRASEQFAAFMNERGLPILIKNTDFYGSDEVVKEAEDWIKDIEEQKKQMQGQPTPEQMQMQAQQQMLQFQQQQLEIEKMKIQNEKEIQELKAQVMLIKVQADDAVSNKEADIKLLDVMSRIEDADAQMAINQEKVDAENARSAVDMAINVASHHHQVKQDNKEAKKVK